MAEKFERRRLKVYVAGPISTGDRFENVHRALRMGRTMVQDGLAPYVPHLDAYLLAKPTDISWNAYLEWDMEWVAVCDAVYRLAGESRGADVEVRHAKALGIPVFFEGMLDRAYEDVPGMLDRAYEDLLAMADDLDLAGVRL